MVGMLINGDHRPTASSQQIVRYLSRYRKHVNKEHSASPADDQEHRNAADEDWWVDVEAMLADFTCPISRCELPIEYAADAGTSFPFT